ncbi:GvpL/GvpF family gas vesicle protein [Streptomyces sp. NBC_00448]|uniref:GvpL/GvpF family gas vesicle protein n=1 Tax=Streptomyces sp. NBC_00448 TaxID=2903652 RepID=UPI002E1DEE67
MYVYGLTRAGLALPRPLHGVGDPPARLRKLVAGSLAAVVSAAPEKVRACRRDLQAHQAVLLAVAGLGPLLPSRFGVVAAGDDDVLARLHDGPEGYAAALDRVADRVELNLKVFPREGGLMDLVREDPGVRRLRQEVRQRPGYDASIRLGEAVMTGLCRRAAAVAREAVVALTALADEVQAGPEVPGCVLNLSFLVPDAHMTDCREVVDDLAEQFADRADLRLTGPLPCYSFCELPTPAGV